MSTEINQPINEKSGKQDTIQPFATSSIEIVFLLLAKVVIFDI